MGADGKRNIIRQNCSYNGRRAGHRVTRWRNGFWRRGAKVAFCALRQESVDGAVARLKGKGDVLGVVTDVSKYDEVKRFIAAVVREFGRIDILVNNAGIRTVQIRYGTAACGVGSGCCGVNLSAALLLFPREFCRSSSNRAVATSSTSARFPLSTSAFAGGYRIQRVEGRD